MECARQTDDRNLFIWNGRPSQWSTMLASEPTAQTYLDSRFQEYRLSTDELFTTHDFYGKPVNPSFAFTNHGLRITLALVDIDKQRYKVVRGWPTRYSICYQIVPISQNYNEPAVFEWWSYSEESNDTIFEQWKIGILGTFQSWSDGAYICGSSTYGGNHKGHTPAFAILLKKVSPSSHRYERVASSMLTCTPSKLIDRVKTIFIL